MTTESLIVELDARTSKIDAKLKQTENRLDQLDGSVKKADSSFATMAKGAAVAAAAAAAAFTVTVNAAVRFANELEVAARRSGESVERMQELAFATETVGISLEKLGDIAKDTNEKIGEFIATGGGGFQDFVDVMKLGSDEARDLALELQNMSGPDVLQHLVTMMEEAGISGNQMSFALEGLASDATDLIPLLENGGDELARLTGEFEKLGTTLSQEQIDNIQRVGEEMRILQKTFSDEGKQLIADYADEIITAIEVITLLGTKTIDAFNVIATGWGNIIEVSRAAINDLVNGTDTLGQVIEERAQITNEAVDKLMGETQEKMSITIRGGVQAVKTATDEEKASLNQRLTAFRTYVAAASAINSQFLEDNKLIKAGLIVADTAAAVMMQLSSGDPYTAFARAALAAVTGAVQLANALSSKKGGGTISSGSGGGAATAQAPQQDFQRETTGLELTDASEEGSTVQTIRFATDTGDSLADAIAAALNAGREEGRF